jgi:predicted nucleotidyltransferase
MPISMTQPSSSFFLTVEDVTARLALRPEVDGVVMMGSGGKGSLSPSSDIDLLIILDEALPDAKMISTTIEGRLTEIYFVLGSELYAWLDDLSILPQESFTAVRMRWIESGQVLFDRSGRLGRLQAALGAGEWSTPPDDTEVYTAWYLTNYDLTQTRRLVFAEDEVSWMKADLRMLRMLSELWARYFLVRKLPAQSEKERIRWMKDQDPSFLVAFQDCLRTVERKAKFTQYVDLARRVLEPTGGLWPENTTAVDLVDGDSEKAEQVLEQWAGWLAAD